MQDFLKLDTVKNDSRFGLPVNVVDGQALSVTMMFTGEGRAGKNSIGVGKMKANPEYYSNRHV